MPSFVLSDVVSGIGVWSPDGGAASLLEAVEVSGDGWAARNSSGGAVSARLDCEVVALSEFPEEVSATIRVKNTAGGYTRLSSVYLYDANGLILFYAGVNVAITSVYADIVVPMARGYGGTAEFVGPWSLELMFTTAIDYYVDFVELNYATACNLPDGDYFTTNWENEVGGSSSIFESVNDGVDSPNYTTFAKYTTTGSCELTLLLPDLPEPAGSFLLTLIGSGPNLGGGVYGGVGLTAAVVKDRNGVSVAAAGTNLSAFPGGSVGTTTRFEQTMAVIEGNRSSWDLSSDGVNGPRLQLNFADSSGAGDFIENFKLYEVELCLGAEGGAGGGSGGQRGENASFFLSMCGPLGGF